MQPRTLSAKEITVKKKTKTASTAAPVQQVAGFITKFDPALARVIRSVRSALRKRFPTANELVYDNYNFFVIGYCSTERPSDCIVSLAANAKGVGLAFYYGAKLPDPDKLLLGSGSQNRFIRLESATRIDFIPRVCKASAYPRRSLCRRNSLRSRCQHDFRGYRNHQKVSL